MNILTEDYEQNRADASETLDAAKVHANEMLDQLAAFRAKGVRRAHLWMVFSSVCFFVSGFLASDVLHWFLK